MLDEKFIILGPVIGFSAIFVICIGCMCKMRWKNQMTLTPPQQISISYPPSGSSLLFPTNETNQRYIPTNYMIPYTVSYPQNPQQISYQPYPSVLNSYQQPPQPSAPSGISV